MHENPAITFPPSGDYVVIRLPSSLWKQEERCTRNEELFQTSRVVYMGKGLLVAHADNCRESVGPGNEDATQERRKEEDVHAKGRMDNFLFAGVYVGIADWLRRVRIAGARWIEEHLDDQYAAVSHLVASTDPDTATRVVLSAALVSYQLSGRGEAWWWEVSRWFSGRDVEDVVEAFREFLPASRNNRRFTGAKVRRLERIRPFLEPLGVADCGDFLRLWRGVSKALKTRPEAKTVVFAVKMCGYAWRAWSREFRPFPMDIPIPVDRRVEEITRRLGGEDPRAFWQGIAEDSGVPPLHIDSVIWVAWNPEKREEIERRFGFPAEMKHAYP